MAVKRYYRGWKRRKTLFDRLPYLKILLKGLDPYKFPELVDNSRPYHDGFARFEGMKPTVIEKKKPPRERKITIEHRFDYDQK
jgi:hypothetical protein